HPTQLYEAGAELVILIVLLVTERKGKPFPGRTFWLYMLLYSISRFIIEFYRGDDRGNPIGTLSTSQLISVLLAPLAVVMLVYLSRAVTPEPKRARKGPYPLFRWFTSKKGYGLLVHGSHNNRPRRQRRPAARSVPRLAAAGAVA